MQETRIRVMEVPTMQKLRLRAPARRWWTAIAAALALAILASPAATAASSAPGPGQLTTSAALGAGVTPTIVGGSSPSGASCQNYYLTVAESPAATQTYQVWAQLCSRGPLAGKTVQVLVPGGDYTHVYWDWPNQPSLYCATAASGCRSAGWSPTATRSAA
jgi:hypothetical protein